MSKFTNIFGTITAILTAISGFLVTIGCTPGAVDFAATCSIPWLPPAWVAIVAAVFGVITFVLKLTRPGGALGSLFGSTAVVVPETSPHSTAGTVTPQQVASP